MPLPARSQSELQVDLDLEPFTAAGQCRFFLAWQSRLPRGYCAMHAHQHIEIVLAAAGRGRTQVADGPLVPLNEGSLVVYPAMAVHDHTALTAGRHVCVHVVSPAPLPACGGPCLHLARVDAYIHSEMELLAQIGKPPEDGSRLWALSRLSLDLRASALLLHILHCACQTDAAGRCTPAEHHADLAQRIVQEQLHTLRSVKDIAEQVGISEDYLRHAFKLRFGISLHQFLVRARLNRIKDLLLHSSMSLKAIAPACGLRDERYLCQFFRAHERCTPGQFRKQRPSS